MTRGEIGLQRITRTAKSSRANKIDRIRQDQQDKEDQTKSQDMQVLLGSTRYIHVLLGSIRQTRFIMINRTNRILQCQEHSKAYEDKDI
jgi:hypothetical protein